MADETSNYIKTVGVAMKQIEIDDEVFVCLQSKAIPYDEKTPNDTLRRLLGIKKKNEKNAN